MSNFLLTSLTKKPILAALLIDVSGTLIVGSEPTPGAVNAFKHLVSSHFPFRLCSNTSKESTMDLIKRLDASGFPLSDALTKAGTAGTNLVWTSIGAVAQALKDLGCTS
jgi:ribonucleotide monophosphatase NagD (HAD superfamily)